MRLLRATPSAISLQSSTEQVWKPPWLSTQPPMFVNHYSSTPDQVPSSLPPSTQSQNHPVTMGLRSQNQDSGDPRPLQSAKLTTASSISTQASFAHGSELLTFNSTPARFQNQESQPSMMSQPSPSPAWISQPPTLISIPNLVSTAAPLLHPTLQSTPPIMAASAVGNYGPSMGQFHSHVHYPFSQVQNTFQPSMDLINYQNGLPVSQPQRVMDPLTGQIGYIPNGLHPNHSPHRFLQDPDTRFRYPDPNQANLSSASTLAARNFLHHQIKTHLFQCQSMAQPAQFLHAQTPEDRTQIQDSGSSIPQAYPQHDLGEPLPPSASPKSVSTFSIHASASYSPELPILTNPDNAPIPNSASTMKKKKKCVALKRQGVVTVEATEDSAQRGKRCYSCSSTVPGNGLRVRWYTCCDACRRLFVKGNYCQVCVKVTVNQFRVQPSSMESVHCQFASVDTLITPFDPGITICSRNKVEARLLKQGLIHFGSLRTS